MTTLKETLLEREHAFWKANLAGDGAYYAAALADDALVVSPWGVQDRDAIVATVSANAVPYTGYEIDEVRCLPLTGDSAILTYRARVSGERAGTPFTHTVYATSAYVRRGGEWTGASFHQQSLVATPA
jgi:ketosteroid isomerase-like protein